MDYCVKKTKYLLLIVVSILLFNPINIFSSNIYNSYGWDVISSNHNELSLSFKPVIIGFDTITTTNGQLTIIPKIKGAVLVKSSDGGPMSFVVSQNITVPSKNGFQLNSYKINSYTKINSLIAPNPFYKKVNKDDFQTIYKIKADLYNKTKESKQVELTYKGLARNRYIAELKINVAHYDKNSNSILIPKEVIVKILFSKPAFQNNKSTIDDYDLPISINNLQTKDWKINYSKIINKNNKNEKTQEVKNQTWVKIKIDKEGIYQISKSMLSNLGYYINKDEINTIKIYGNGGLELSENVIDGLNNKLNEQNIIVKTKNGELDKIIFYAAAANGFRYDSIKGFNHYINHYSNSNYYLLTWKGEQSKSFEPIESPTGEVVNRPVTYTHRMFYEEELNNAYTGGSGRQWFGRNLLPAIFTEQLYNLDRKGDILYRASVAHRANDYGTFSIFENNKAIMDINLNPVSGYNDANRQYGTSIQAASIISSDDRSILKFSYKNSGGSSALGYFDWYEIHYPAFLLPVDDEIYYYTSPELSGLTEYSINNFSNNNIYGFNVGDPANPRQIKNISTTGGMFVFRVNLEKKHPQRYFISAKIKTPALESIKIANLRSDFANSDLVVITSPLLIKSANNYKNYREKQSNISVSIVTTDDIYNEFNAGMLDPVAIRDFLAFAFANWSNKPKYVLLWGDGHYDYKQISTTAPNFVPTYQVDNNTTVFSEIDSYTSDEFFTTVAGDDRILDIAIGREPVYSDVSGDWIVEKIKHYENNSSLDTWRTNMTIVADNSWTTDRTDGTLHTGQAERLWRNILPDDIQVKKIYLPEYPTINVAGGKRIPRANEDLVSTVNTSGNLFLCWIGHGNPRVWAHEEIFERSITVPQMKNLDKLFFLTAASCDFGRFDTPEIRSGAEELILSKVGGAIGTFSSTRLVYAEPNAQLNELLYTNFFNRNPQTGNYYTIGEVFYQTKALRVYNNDKKYCLLGDPCVKLLLPENRAIIDSLNHIYVADEKDTVTLKALSTVDIKGHITYPSSTITDKTFNGTAIITMLDCDQDISVLEDDGTKSGTTHNIVKYGGALNRSAVKVTNGEYEAKFIIPKDISFLNRTGRLFVYAYSDDNHFAKGDTRDFVLSGIDSSSIIDNTPPVIKIYLDSRDFVSGDYVRCIPLLMADLADDSGINTTGLGLGHRIEAWIDNKPKSFDITDKFNSSLTNHNSGTVEDYIFNLEPGLHTVKVRAWDVFNNFSEAETSFRTSDCDGIIINNLINYPNPTENLTTIKFNHNISPPFDVQIDLYDILGQKINTFNSTINSAFTAEIPINCIDKNNKALSIGNYLYRLNITNANGIRKNVSSYLTIKR